MATIGNFQQSGENEFNGEIVTLSLQAKKVRIVPDTRASGENTPSHRVFVGRVEIGAGWSKQSNEGRNYLGLKLDDPSFTAPIYANLVEDEDGQSHSLIWSRPNRRNGDLRTPTRRSAPGGASSGTRRSGAQKHSLTSSSSCEAAMGAARNIEKE